MKIINTTKKKLLITIAALTLTYVAYDIYSQKATKIEENAESQNISLTMKKKIVKLAINNGITGIFRISSTPLGLYEVVSDKGVFYIDDSMEYAVKGTVISLKSGKNFTAEADGLYRSKLALINSKNKHETLTSLLQNNSNNTLSTSFQYPQLSPASTTKEVALNATPTNNNLRELGDSLIQNINDEKSNKSITDKEYFGTVEGQALALKEKEKEKMLNEIRRKHGLLIQKEKQEAKEQGKLAIPKIGYDKNGNKLSEKETARDISKFVNTVNESWATIYRAKHEKTLIVAFTSYTCGYCRKLHEAIPELNERGISVAYINFPRTGQESEIENMKDAWCAPDQKDAINKLYHGQGIPTHQCKDLSADIKKHRASEDVISKQAFFGKVFGVIGTPTIITKGGKLISGFSGVDSFSAIIANELK